MSSDAVPPKSDNQNQSKGKGGGNRNRNRGRGNKGNGNNNNNNNHNNNQPSKSKPDHPEPQIIVEEEEEAPEHHYCLICYSSHLHEERGITPCGHDEICASCHLRLRSLLCDSKCPICKASNQQIIIDADPDPSLNQHKKFQQYEKWGDDIGPNYTYREDVGMFFPTSYYHTKVTPLFALRCNVQRCQFTNDSSESNSPGTHKSLMNHLATAHNPPLQICDLCITHKRDFISRLPRFTANQLKEHNKYGEYGEGGGKKNAHIGSAAGKANRGHPICNFCQPQRFYDLTELHKHLNKEHYECFVCKKLEKPLQFFKDYNKLNVHYDREHFLCRFPECLAARFVVFSNEIDLKAHERDMHGLVTGGSTKIQMEFRVRSSGRDGSGVVHQNQHQQVPNMDEDFSYRLDGEVFVPESLDDANNSTTNNIDLQANEPEITHGPHAERTALLRDQAREKREQMGITGDNSSEIASTEEAFPTLGSQRGGAMNNWSREGGGSSVSVLRKKNTTTLNQQNFPSLGGPSETAINKKTSKLRSTRGVNNQFSAMSLAANAAVSTSRPFANAAGTQQSFFSSSASNTRSSMSMPKLSANNFPTLGGGGPRLGTDSFPSLGGGGGPSMGGGNGNKYTAAQAYTKKSMNSRGMNLKMDQHFPAPSLSNSTTSISAKKKNGHVLLEKKSAAKLRTDNMLAFPPPPSAGASASASAGNNQVEGMKLALGQAKYKQLKKSTKAFASNTLDPESYISAVVSLFDDGIQDPTLWEFIPGLISSCPHESNTKRAMRYLESLRFSSGQSAPKVSTNSSNNRAASSTSGWASTAASASAAFASSNPTPTPIKYGSFASRAAAFAPSRQNITTGFTGRSLPVPQVKKQNSWGGNNKMASKPGSMLAAAASRGPQNGTATKFMAKEKAQERKAKQKESIAKQGENVKKKKAKAMKNELRDLAFGKK